ncbi:hypothetical protein BHM03_00055341 [Ensete ventricosum]|nr:hypothetical protein BHM03_00055341 [Ensete ventricosum]
MVSRKNSTITNFTQSHARIRVSTGFRSLSQKFKILAIPNVLAHGKSYELGFMKKHDDHKLGTKSKTKSSFNRFFVHRLGNLKYWSFPTYYRMRSRASMVS